MANPEAVLVAKSLVPRLRRLAKRLASADTRPTSVEFDNGFSYPEALAELLADACKFTVQVAELLDWPVASWKPLMFAVASVEQGLEFPENRRQEFEGLADSFRAYLRGTLRDMIPALSLNTGSLASLDKWEEKLDPATTGFVHSSHEVAFLVPVNDENIEHVNRQLADDAASACRYMAELLKSRLNETTKANADAVAATPETVVLNDTLLRILKVLDGKAMRVEELAKAVTGGEQSRLYKAGLKKTLEAQGHVAHVRGIGYFRPDKPPADRVLPAKKLGAKK